MSLLSRIASYFKQPFPPQDDININTLRIMGTGPCAYSFVVGIFNAPCPCQHGVFNIQSKTQGNEKCQACTHPLSLHEDFNVSTQSLPGRPSDTTATNMTANTPALTKQQA